MVILASRENYGSYALPEHADGPLEPDTFDAFISWDLTGKPVYLTNGEVVGKVAQGHPILAGFAEQVGLPEGTPALDVLWKSELLRTLAEQAELRIEGGRVVLVGGLEPVRKRADTVGAKLLRGERVEIELSDR